MSGEPHRSEVERAERWAIMEWLLVGARLRIALMLALLVAMALTVGILYADGVSRLNRRELHTFVQRQNEESLPRSMTGPLFGRLHEPR